MKGLHFFAAACIARLHHSLIQALFGIVCGNCLEHLAFGSAIANCQVEGVELPQA
jgi:hypothetical protein